jgi:hypothetical protein
MKKSPLTQLGLLLLLVWFVCNVILFFTDRERWKANMVNRTLPFLFFTFIVLLLLVGGILMFGTYLSLHN